MSRLALAGLLVVAAAGRIYEIDAADVWVDEANLVLTSGKPVGELLAQLRVDSSPPLYYLLVHFWSVLFGDGAFALRLLSTLAGVGLVAAVWWAGRDWVSPSAGAWAAVFVAFSPIQMFYSQQIRMYALLSLLALLSTVFLVRFLRDGLLRDFGLWVITATLALYTHNFAFHLGVAHALIVALSGQLRSRLWWWAGAAAAVAFLYAPWVPTLLAQLGNRDHYAWFAHYWSAWGPLGALGKTLQSYSPAGEFLTYQGIGSFALWHGVPTWVVTALAAWGAFDLLRRARSGSVVGAVWPLVLLLAPALSALAASGVATPHYVSGRVDQMMLPAFALLVGAGLSALRPRPLGVALGVTIAALGVYAKINLYFVYADDPLRGGDQALSNVLAERWRPGDVILTTSLSRAPIAYYLHRAGVDATLVSFPRAAAHHLGAQNDDRLLADRPALLAEAVATLDEVRSQLGEDGRLFMVWVRSLVNYPLRHEGMSELGFAEIDALGRYRQYGTALLIDTRVYRPVN